MKTTYTDLHTKLPQGEQYVAWERTDRGLDICDCSELKHAAMAPRGKKVILACPYQPDLN